MASFVKDGVTYYQLYISCPVCIDRGTMVPQSYWVHGDECGGNIYLGENAYYYCDKCGHTAHVMKWAYKCPVHSSEASNEYLEASPVALAQAVSTAGQMVTETGIAWLQTFLKNMENPNN